MATEPVKADFVVAPGGQADASGSADQPFATLDEARAAVRRLKSDQPDRAEPIVVLVRGGSYALDATIAFTPEDSGTAEAPVIYRAWPGEGPILHGGRRIAGWQTDERGWWTAKLTESDWRFRQLHVNGQRRYRTRLPEHGYHSIADRREPTPADGNLPIQGDDRFAYWPGDIHPSWAGRDDVELMMVHLWGMTRTAIAEVDADRREVRTKGRSWSQKGFGNYERGRRYVVENAPEALGAPGRWHLDSAAGKLVYVPAEGEKPDEAQVIAPRVETLLRFTGEYDQPVEHLRFEGLTFAYTNWKMIGDQQSMPQVEVNVSGAIEGRRARHLAFTGCTVRGISNYAMAFDDGSSHIRIESCDLYDLGAGGIKLGDNRMHDTHPDEPIPTDPRVWVHHCGVRDCLIAHGGRLHPAGIGVWIGHAHHNTVEHNTITDFYYSGINVGWVWGYAPSPAHDNEIAFNRIGPLGHGVLSDMGGVYCLGRSPGTMIHHNVIHHVHSFDYGGWGLYLDEGSSGIAMEHNLVYRTTDGGLAQHFGRGNRFAGNIFAYSLHKQLSRNNKHRKHTSFTFESNIVYWTVGPLHGAGWVGHGFVCDRNIYFNALGRPIGFGAEQMTFDQWRAFGQDFESRLADPGFADPANDDYRLPDDSPALALGFERWDHDRAGIVSRTDRRLPETPHAWPVQAPLNYNR